MELKSRKDIPIELTWDLSSIYKTEEEMNQDIEKVTSLSSRILQDYKGKLDSPQKVNACLDKFREVERLLTLINHYCDLAVAVDYYDTYNQERNERILSLISEISSSLSFIAINRTGCILKRNAHWPHCPKPCSPLIRSTI